AAEHFNVLLEALVVGQDLPRPLHHALAFGREPHEPRLANHETHVELALERLEAGGKRRLRDVADFGCPPEMLLPGQRDEIGHLANEHGAFLPSITPTTKSHKLDYHNIHFLPPPQS